jgi:hypothetical protein
LVDRVYEGREKTNEGVVTFLNKVCENEFEPFIESSYQALAEYVSAYDQKMVMARRTLLIVVYGLLRSDTSSMYGIVRVFDMMNPN